MSLSQADAYKQYDDHCRLSSPGYHAPGTTPSAFDPDYPDYEHGSAPALPHLFHTSTSVAPTSTPPPAPLTGRAITTSSVPVAGIRAVTTTSGPVTITTYKPALFNPDDSESQLPPPYPFPGSASAPESSSSPAPAPTSGEVNLKMPEDEDLTVSAREFRNSHRSSKRPAPKKEGQTEGGLTEKELRKSAKAARENYEKRMYPSAIKRWFVFRVISPIRRGVVREYGEDFTKAQFCKHLAKRATLAFLRALPYIIGFMALVTGIAACAGAPAALISWTGVIHAGQGMGSLVGAGVLYAGTGTAIMIGWKLFNNYSRKKARKLMMDTATREAMQRDLRPLGYPAAPGSVDNTTAPYASTGYPPPLDPMPKPGDPIHLHYPNYPVHGVVHTGGTGHVPVPTDPIHTATPVSYVPPQDPAATTSIRF